VWKYQLKLDDFDVMPFVMAIMIFLWRILLAIGIAYGEKYSVMAEIISDRRERMAEIDVQ
jgi:hypothetical protein